MKVVAEGNITGFSDEFFQDLPSCDRYSNILTLAPGVQDADGDGNPNVHGSRQRDFKAIVSGASTVDPLTGGWMSRVNPNSIEEMEAITAGVGVAFGRAQGGFSRIVQKQGGSLAAEALVGPNRSTLLEPALRVLADVADDGKLSPADGIPATAALLAMQSRSGALSRDVGLHAIGAWALAEAAIALPDDPWVAAGAARAFGYLAELLVTMDGDRRLANGLSGPTSDLCMALFSAYDWQAAAGNTAPLTDFLAGLRESAGGLSPAVTRALDRFVSLAERNVPSME